MKNDDGWYSLPSPENWEVRSCWDRLGGWYWVARNRDGFVTDPGDRYNRRPRAFDTADDAIEHIIGVPQ